MTDRPTATDGARKATRAARTMTTADADALAARKWFGSAWFEAWGTLGAEFGEFVAGRIAEDVRTQHAMLNCRSPAELAAVQAEFIRTAIEQYTAETGKLVSRQQELIGRMAGPREN